MKQVDAALASILSKVSDSEMTQKAMQNCRDVSQDMEDILFSIGGPDRLLTTLRIFRDRPAIRELDVVKQLIQKDSPDTLISKEEEINKGVVDSLQEFLALFRCDRVLGK